MIEKLYQDKEWLEDQYWNLKKSSRKIAEICACSKSTILKKLRKFNIKVRTNNEINSGQFKKGYIPLNGFKKGHIPWHKGKKGVYSKEQLRKMSESHKQIARKDWNDLSIDAKHNRISWVKPKPLNCEKCGKKAKRLDLSSRTHEYTQDPNEYRWLCVSCHLKYDIKIGVRSRYFGKNHRGVKELQIE